MSIYELQNDVNSFKESVAYVTALLPDGSTKESLRHMLDYSWKWLCEIGRDFDLPPEDLFLLAEAELPSSPYGFD